MIWSDETKIDRFGSDGNRNAWKRVDETLQTKHVRQTVKHGGGNIKLWSCITYDGVGFMTKLNENLTAIIYKTILEEEHETTINYYKLDKKKLIFEQNNDPKHTAKLVRDWLEDKPFEVMDWPAQSNLNPIENMWALLKRSLFSDYNRPPNGMLELWERTYTVWYKITKEECIKVIESMPKRCEPVIKAKRRWTKY